MKDLRQSSNRQWYGFVFMWIFWCSRTLPRWAKRLPHFVHWNGFSPVCRRSCVLGSSVQASSPSEPVILTLKLPSCEKRDWQPGRLQTYTR